MSFSYLYFIAYCSAADGGISNPEQKEKKSTLKLADIFGNLDLHHPGFAKLVVQRSAKKWYKEWVDDCQPNYRTNNYLVPCRLACCRIFNPGKREPLAWSPAKK